MAWILSEEWLWIIVLALIAVLIGPLLIVWLVLALPAELKLVATVLIVIGWGIASGYKDWILEKRRREEEEGERSAHSTEQVSSLKSNG